MLGVGLREREDIRMDILASIRKLILQNLEDGENVLLILVCYMVWVCVCEKPLTDIEVKKIPAETKIYINFESNFVINGIVPVRLSG